MWRSSITVLMFIEFGGASGVVRTSAEHAVRLELQTVANAMVMKGKGLLAADESSGTIKKRFDDINVVSTEETRRDYREMLFRPDEAISRYISGVILYDET